MTLTIAELTEANVTRCERDFEHPLEGWSLMEWGAACAGEIGEACNVAKKLKRLDMGLYRFTKPGEDTESLKAKLADEIADGVHYAVLWASAAGIDLEAVLRSKFNEVSDRVGSEIKL